MMRGVVFALAVAVASPAFAQAAPDAATLAAAREMMKVSDVQGQMRAIGPRMAEAVGQQIKQMFRDNQIPDGLNAQLTAAMQANFASMDSMFTPELIDRIAGIYARHFSEAELKRIVALMQDPAMAKFRTEMPAMMAEMMPMVFEAVKPRQQQFQQKVMQIIADWIKQHPEDKAKLRSPAAS